MCAIVKECEQLRSFIRKRYAAVDLRSNRYCKFREHSGLVGHIFTENRSKTAVEEGAIASPLRKEQA